MERKLDIKTEKIILPEIEKTKNAIKNLLEEKFLKNQNIAERDIKKVIGSNLPELNTEDLNFPEKRDDRITILQPGIEALIEKFSDYRENFKPLNDFEKADLAESKIPDSAKQMINYFVDFLSENYFQKIEA